MLMENKTCFKQVSRLWQRCFNWSFNARKVQILNMIAKLVAHTTWYYKFCGNVGRLGWRVGGVDCVLQIFY
jgi:hypothetical protein